MQHSKAADHWPYKGLKRLKIFPSYFQIFSIKFCQKLTDGDESFSITEVVQALGTLEFCWVLNWNIKIFSILVILIHSHGLSSFLKSLGKDQPSQGRLQKITERKSIEFLDIVDKSLDQQAWKNVQKELKRKRSFSEGEISTNYQSKVSQNSKRQAAVQAVERVDAKLTGDIRIQVSKAKTVRLEIKLLCNI